MNVVHNRLMYLTAQLALFLHLELQPLLTIHASAKAISTTHSAVVQATKDEKQIQQITGMVLRCFKLLQGPQTTGSSHYLDVLHKSSQNKIKNASLHWLLLENVQFPSSKSFIFFLIWFLFCFPYVFSFYCSICPLSAPFRSTEAQGSRIQGRFTAASSTRVDAVVVS